MKLTKVELIKVLIKYLDAHRTPIIEEGLWMRNIRSENEGTTLTPFVKGHTLDVLVAMIEDNELIVWPYSDTRNDNFSEKKELRYAHLENNSTIILLEENKPIYKVVCDVILFQGTLIVQQPPEIRYYDEVEAIRTPEGFLQYAEMMDEIENPSDLVNDIFHKGNEKSVRTGFQTTD